MFLSVCALNVAILYVGANHQILGSVSLSKISITMNSGCRKRLIVNKLLKKKSGEERGFIGSFVCKALLS